LILQNHETATFYFVIPIDYILEVVVIILLLDSWKKCSCMVTITDTFVVSYQLQAMQHTSNWRESSLL